MHVLSHLKTLERPTIYRNRPLIDTKPRIFYTQAYQDKNVSPYLQIRPFFTDGVSILIAEEY